MTDDLKSKAERAAEAVYRVLPDELSGPRIIGYVAGYLAHAKEAEALVSKLESCLERIGQMEGYCVAIEDAEAAITRYRGGAK